VVLYGYKTWSLTLRKEHRKKVFANRVLNGQVKEDEIGRACRATRNAHGLLVEKRQAKRPLGRPKYSWMDNIKMDLGETGWGGMDWIDVAQDMEQCKSIVYTVTNLRISLDTERLRDWGLVNKGSAGFTSPCTVSSCED
jgi:hypothetical protein